MFLGKQVFYGSKKILRRERKNLLIGEGRLCYELRSVKNIILQGGEACALTQLIVCPFFQCVSLESGEDSVFHTPLIVQLTNEKGDMVREQVVTRPGKISFLHLKGGKHGIRAIVDSNRDGKWTPGNYWQHRQPEAVLFFEKTLELRENWDMEEKWNIGSNH